MKKYYLLLVFFLIAFVGKAQFFPPEEVEDLELKIDLTAEKRLADYLKEYEAIDDWSGAVNYYGPTALDISGLITREDLDVLSKISTIKKVDAEHAQFKDDTVPSFAFCIDAFMYQIGIATLEEVILPTNIVAIEAFSFTACPNLRKVNLEQLAGLKEIGMNAFSQCGLTEVKIPAACTDFTFSAFEYCMNLMSVQIDAGNSRYQTENSAVYDKQVNALVYFPKGATTKTLTVKAGTDSIAMACFSGNEYLEEVVLPQSLTKVGDNLFDGTTALKSITVPGGIKSINGMFSNSNIENVTLSEGIEEIGPSCFTNCVNLKSITLPKTTKQIGFMAFNRSSNLMSVNFQDLTALNLIDDRAFMDCPLLDVVDLSKAINMNNIGNEAFQNCKGVHTLKLPANLEIIGSRAFSGCENLDLDVLPNSLIEIGESTFANNLSLSSISIGPKVTMIGNGAFSNCRNVSDVLVDTDNVNYVLYEGMIVTSDGVTIVFVPVNTTIEELDLTGMSVIGNYVLAGNKSVKRVLVSDQLTTIGESAFANMEQLTSIDLSKCTKLRAIGKKAFAGSLNLITAVLPADDNTKSLSIGESAFEGCEKLQSVNIPAQTSTVGMYAFRNCTSLETVDLSKATKLTAITDLFMGCSALTQVQLHDKMSRIGDFGFFGCKSMESFKFPNALSYNITGTMFQNSGVKNFLVDDAHTSLKSVNGALYSKDGTQLLICPPVTTGEYVIPEGVKKIGTKAFAGIHAITKIHLPSTIEKPQYQNIEDSFHEMHGLTSFVAADDHANLSVIDDAIYSKDKKTLYAYPAGKMVKSITLAPELEVVNRAAFDNNKNVEEILFPANLKRLGMSFINATGLRKIELPAGLTSMSSAFDGAANLSEVVCHAVTPPSIDPYTFRNTNVTSVYVPKTSVDAYTTNKYWGAYTILPIDPLAVDQVHDADLQLLYLDGKVVVDVKDDVQSVNVFNTAGQMIKQSFETSFMLNAPKGVVVVVVKLENGKVLTGKLMVK